MILMIIFIVLTIIGTVMWVLTKKYDYKLSEVVDTTLTITGATLTVLFGLITIIGGMWCVMANNPMTYENERIAYVEKVDSLNATYSVLITNVDNESYKISIQQYNQEIREFKTEIKTNQKWLNNPWTNWFMCKEYKNMDVNAVSYITVE